MKEYGFFPSNNDRKYSAEDFCSYFSDIFTDGVLGSDTLKLKVTPKEKMTLNISSGTAYIKGHFFRPLADKTVTLSDSDSVYGRYDLIVIRCDYVSRSVYLTKIDGIPSAEPVIPEIMRDESYYDLCIAKIYVRVNATEITAADITDTRFDTALCGIVTGAVDTIDTTDLFAQYEAAWDLLVAGFSGSEADVIAAWAALNAVKSVNDKVPVDGNINLKVEDLPDKTGLAKVAVLFDGSVTRNVGITLTQPITDFEYIAVIVGNLDNPTRTLAITLLPPSIITYNYSLNTGCYDGGYFSFKFNDALTYMVTYLGAYSMVLGINRF